MTTHEVFVIENGNYDEGADEWKDVFMAWEDKNLNIDPPLTDCSETDLLELAAWIKDE